MKISLLVILGIFFLGVFLTQGADAKVVTPNVVAQDEKIKIISGIGYTDLQLSNQGDVGWFPQQLTDSAIFLEFVNVSNETIYDIEIDYVTYSNARGMLDVVSGAAVISDEFWASNDHQGSCFPLNRSLEPGASGTYACFAPTSGWDCFETYVSDYRTIGDTRAVFGYDRDGQLIVPHEYADPGEKKTLVDFKIKEDYFQRLLEIKDVKDINGLYKGKVKNTSEHKMDFVWVWAIKYGKNNALEGILGYDAGSLSPNKEKNFQIDAYVNGYPSVTGDKAKLFYKEPRNVEFFAEGYVNDNDATKYDNFEVASNFYKGGITASHIDLENITPLETEKLCEGSVTDLTNIVMKEKFDALKKIPDYIKNPAGWWANGSITEDEFLRSIDYLIEHAIIKIYTEKKIFHMEINNDRFYVTPHNDVILKLTGWYDNDNYQEKIRCEFTHPEVQYAMKSTILREWDGTATFESYVDLNPDWKEGIWNVSCSWLDEELFTSTFEIIHGDEPEGYFDYKKTKVPTWVKNNAGWWAEGLIDDNAFAQGIEFLIKEGIIDAGKYS